MIRNYFKIAWRNLKRHRFYAGINILGLCTGIVFTLLISAYVWGELQVNNTLKNANRQYILLSDWQKPNMGLKFTTLAPLAKHLKEDYPHLIANYYRFDGVNSIISKDDLRFRKYVQLSDSSLLTMFGFGLLHGNSKTALTHPNTAVITKNVALKVFGKTDVVGQTIALENFNSKKRNFSITGVFNTLPKNSIINPINENITERDLMPEIFISKSSHSFFDRGDLSHWDNRYIPSFIELQKGVSAKDLQKPIKALIAKHAPKNIKENLSVAPKLLTNFYLEKDNGTVKRMLITLSIIGVFILLMAVVNFINISISMSGSRLKEIGMRKVLGGQRKQLIMQFLIESFILVLLATVLAFVAFVVLKPVFRDALGFALPEVVSFSYLLVFIIFGFVCTVSLLAGCYPAFVLSSLKTIQSLKGKLQLNNIRLQKSLVGFQFSIALVILISAFIITKQVDYFFEKDLGYNKDYMLTVQTPRNWSDEGVKKMETIRREFEHMPQISKVSLSYEIPNGNFGQNFSFSTLNMPENEAIPITSLTVDDHFFSTYQITVNAQLDVSGENHQTICLNESAAKTLGWENPMDAIGEKIKIKDGEHDYTIQTVVGDFHFDTMTKQIKPLVFFNLKTFPIYRYLNFRLKPGNLEATITSIHKKWNKILPNTVFDYEFMDNTLHKLYTSEIRFKKAVYYACVLSLIIIFLGIVGLVSLSAHNRLKEMGVRKVLGASKINIIKLFVKDFSTVIMVSSVIAIPLAFYFTGKWLNNFAYSINVTPIPFIAATLLLIIVTFLLIGILSFKTAKTNPIKNLRTE